MKLPTISASTWLLPVTLTLLTSAAPLAAQEPTSLQTASANNASSSAQVVSPEAQAVLDRMTRYLRGLKTFSIDTKASRDEVVARGYKLQNNEHALLVVQRPNRLRADIEGDIRNRTIVYDGSRLTMYSPDDAAYVQAAAPDTLAKLIGNLLDNGVEMPLIDVLYQATAGTLTDDTRGGVLVGNTTIDGIDCDHLAFRNPTVDWQMWVEQGARPLPRKILITTRYEVGDPEYQAILDWNLNPRITNATFAFSAPKGATEIPLASVAASDSGSPGQEAQP
jgi:hypothetical protein